eukprot:40386-Prorocentrum_minimum.AAC.1
MKSYYYLTRQPIARCAGGGGEAEYTQCENLSQEERQNILSEAEAAAAAARDAAGEEVRAAEKEAAVKAKAAAASVQAAEARSAEAEAKAAAEVKAARAEAAAAVARAAEEAEAEWEERLAAAKAEAGRERVEANAARAKQVKTLTPIGPAWEYSHASYVRLVQRGNIPTRPTSDWSSVGIFPHVLRPIGPS